MNIVYDLETIKGCFLACFYEPEGNLWNDFWINDRRNDIDKLMKYLDERKGDNFIGYNNVEFDSQIIEWMWRSYNKWYDKDGIELARMIWKKAQDIIDDGKYGLFPPYREWELSFKQTDPLKIQHFDNKNRRVGLKRLEFEMDMEDIEDMPVPHEKEQFSDEELAELLHYCHNDVSATFLNYQYIVGEVEHPIYKSTNQIELREALTETFDVDCTNFSNSKYGDEIIKRIYARTAGISYSELPRKGTFRRSIPLAKCIPKNISFTDDTLNLFLERLKGMELLAGEEFEEAIKYNGQIYTFARGGIHNVIKDKQYHTTEKHVIIDADVTGYYPRTILNNGYYPAHLKKAAFLAAYEWIVKERERIKPLGKLDKKLKGIAAGYKESAVAAYGKSGDATNWMFDLQMMLSVCISGELSILMLIERQEIAGNKCIMANTDGATFQVDRDQIDEFHRICDEWCKETKYSLEFFRMKHMWFLSVNDYLAEYEDYEDSITGKLKGKGDFVFYTELHKNKSYRIIPLALKEYFINGKDIETFINEYSRIYDFCARSSAGDTYRHYGIDDKTNFRLPKLVRFYVSKKGIDIMKMVREDNDTGAGNVNVSPKDNLKTVCNKLTLDVHAEHLANVDREWYIQQAKTLAYRVEHGKPPNKGINTNKDQISLF